MRLAFRIFFLLFFLATSFQSVSATKDSNVLEEIRTCLIDQDAEKLATFFGDKIEVTINGRMHEYARSQAKLVIQSFLESNPPSSIAFAHKGTTTTTLYGLANYQTPEGEFEVDLSLKLAHSEYFLNSIKFDQK